MKRRTRYTTGLKQCFFIWMVMMTAASPVTAQSSNPFDTATFAAGCFWCMEHPFDEIPGVISTTSGYTGGHQDNPTYQQVSSGSTGHTEAIEIVFDPSLVSYEQLLDVYWRNSDPTTANRQFCDSGSQYRPGIFYHNKTQRMSAERSKQKIIQHKDFEADVITEITPASTFWTAEEYHQNYYLKNPIRYKYYRYNCGRDQRLEQLWGKQS